MYKLHFKLEDEPFLNSPAPDSAFQSDDLQEALAHFQHVLEKKEPFFLLIGEAGFGKTTAIQVLLEQIPRGVSAAIINHTTLSPRELLDEVAFVFGLEVVEGEPKRLLIRRMKEHFEQLHQQGWQALLILDEAHLLTPSALEELRLVSNWSDESGTLVLMNLVGQPELAERLRSAKLRSLRQRIRVRYSLKALSCKETGDYLFHRLKGAGSKRPHQIFSPEATRALYEQTHGVPREINMLADGSLLNAYLEDKVVVEMTHVESAAKDYGFEGLTGPRPRSPRRPRQTTSRAPGPAPE